MLIKKTVRDLQKRLADFQPTDAVYVKFGNYRFPIVDIGDMDIDGALIVIPETNFSFMVLDPLGREFALAGIELKGKVDLNDPIVRAYYDKMMRE